MSMLNVPASLEEKTISILSNWVGEYCSIERRRPREYYRVKRKRDKMGQRRSGQDRVGEDQVEEQGTYEQLGLVHPRAVLWHLAVRAEGPTMPELLPERDDRASLPARFKTSARSAFPLVSP